MPNEDRAPNRLIKEKSPYLYQHAYNPVNWYPWGEEAFNKAKAEDKPVFLSVGYSTCHWCHVMAHESFEDDEVAELLNREFVSIKLDREERPDVDAVYMEVCQAMTGSGGWPMTIVMTPDKKPFFAGTYFPKYPRYGTIGLLDLIKVISSKWKDKRSELIESSEEITSFIKKRETAISKSGKPSKSHIKDAKEWFTRSFDKTWGGFGSAPKFPMPHNIIFLLRYAAIENDKLAMDLAEHTLEQMYRGGIFDHIGGGFSRYSTDEKWLIPHFEKMLYDNALLLWAYLDAYELTSRPMYRNIAEKIISYILKELTNTKGAFLCGQDADSDGVEGKYYVFTPEEIKAVLGTDAGEEFCSRFDITQRGNFEGKSVPNLLKSNDLETENSISNEQCKKLYEYRLNRTRLHTDDKVLTSWNSLMIVGLARAGRILLNSEYVNKAIEAQRFITNNLMDEKGRLKIRWKEGEAANEGQLDDYAFYGLALLELYNSTLDIYFIEEAIRIADIMLNLFEDKDNGGFFMYSNDAEQLITRPKPTYDGAVPSGNSVAALVLKKLSSLTGAEKWSIESEKQLEFISAFDNSHPAGHSLSLLAFIEELYPSAELICVNSASDIPDEFKELVSKASIINLNILLKTPENQNRLESVAPFTANYPIPDSGTLYYLCRNKACMSPADSVDKIKMSLSEITKVN